MRSLMAVATLVFGTLVVLGGAGGATIQQTLRVYISVDMEGLSGVGVPEMTRQGGKDYEVGRRMMTEEVNATIEGIREGARSVGIDEVYVLVNDSHGDHRNILIERLADGVEYLQGSVKPYGMAQGLDDSFDAVVFIGYHSRQGTLGMLAHTGSGRTVRDLRINGIPAGEGEMNAALAGFYGVPVVLVAGDAAYVEQAKANYAVDAESVVTKYAVTAHAARLRPVSEVRAELEERASKAIAGLDKASPWQLDAPYVVEMAFHSSTHVDIAEHIPGIERTGPMSVRFRGDRFDEVYPMIRILYRFLSTV